MVGLAAKPEELVEGGGERFMMEKKQRTCGGEEREKGSHDTWMYRSHTM